MTSHLLPALQNGDPFPVLVWTVAGHFLLKTSGNLPVECHYLVFLCGLNYCRHLVSTSTLHTIEKSAAGCLGVMAEDWDSARTVFYRFFFFFLRIHGNVPVSYNSGKYSY